jgi:chromate reductase, NAD(P)H dehydrogenase (quinone)
MPPYRVATIVGSLRRNSYSQQAAQALIALSPPTLAFDQIEIGDLPLYNQDLDVDPPGPWVLFRKSIRAADAVLFVTPEYNRSIPGPLKNAIDIASRPYGESVFDGKPAAIISQSPGAMGGFGANHHLRQSLAFLNMPTLQQPEAYLAHAGALFDPDNGGLDPKTGEFLRAFATAFAAWIERLALLQNVARNV